MSLEWHMLFGGPAQKLPVLEFGLGSMSMPADQVLKELGYSNPEELRAMRLAEDLESDDVALITLLQEMIRILREELKGTPSIIRRLSDKRQAGRKDKTQPPRRQRPFTSLVCHGRLDAYNLEERLGGIEKQPKRDDRGERPGYEIEYHNNIAWDDSQTLDRKLGIQRKLTSRTIRVVTFGR